MIDLDNALDVAESDPRMKDMDKYVLGHSWGGYAAAAVLNFDHDIKACVTMSGYNSPYEKLTEFCDEQYGILGKPIYPIIWLYNKATFGKDSSWKAVDGINKSGIPVEIMHGTADDVIQYNGAAIIAHKDEITNPNVKYVTFSDDGRNGHSSYFTTAEYAKYEAEERIDERYEELEEKYDGEIPHDVLVEFCSGIDQELYNTCDEDFVEMIDSFFKENTN
ncbi:MAG: S9 family peptidase [Ruminococcus sp.]|uniref:alpha/beta hydrolase family protein n=1 Tax=Ruminococcus sp. TaxID=41978 RepID=UPI0025F7CE9F|nr:prolyl oligopeptidase family serine peptidase [Ruminococcus sp.]MCR5600139.1 S9 family peptidase [Ruminococcus sp.]